MMAIIRYTVVDLQAGKCAFSLEVVFCCFCCCFGAEHIHLRTSTPAGMQVKKNTYLKLGFEVCPILMWPMTRVHPLNALRVLSSMIC